jgi:PAS domain S-box-containing protein
MSESIAARVVENAPAMLVYLDADLRVRFANRHCYELLGHAPREILGRLLAELVDPRTLKYALDHVAEVDRGNTAPRDYVLRDKDGAQRFVQVHAVPDRDPNGRSIGYFTCSADNSGARATRRALALAEDRLSHALQALDVGVWDWDLARCTVHYSPEFVALLGYGATGLPADFSFFAILHPDDVGPTHEAVADAMQAGCGFDREFRVRCADGSYRWFRGVGRGARDSETGQVAGFTGTLHDISLRKEAERQLCEANGLVRASLEGCLELAEELSERNRLDSVRRELLASANHELRTPLCAIIAALELLRDRACPTDERDGEAFLELALKNAERLARVVEEWLDMERLDLGVARICRSPLDLAALVASVVGEHAGLATERSLVIETGLAHGATQINADPERLRHALGHLLADAIERSPRDATVRVQVGVREDKVTLLIEDEGQAATSSADLGLSLARVIIERHEGTLCIANRPSTGAAFHVELPRHAGG